MNSQYFAQYLLNANVLSAEQVHTLLEDAMDCKPEVPVRALKQGLITAGQIEELGKLSAEDFAAAVEEKGILTASQVKNLQKSLVGGSLRFAQAMLDAGVADYQKIEQLFKKYNELLVDPVEEAVRRIAGEDLEPELQRYVEYVRVFMRSLIRFMDTTAVIDLQPPACRGEQQTHMVSQRLSGDLNIATGIIASKPVFLELARRYSREEIETVDDLAVDSLSEFLNVMNGLYVVDLAKYQLDVDLELPRTAMNVDPMSNHQLILPIYTSFGAFQLVLASDELFSGGLLL